MKVSVVVHIIEGVKVSVVVHRKCERFSGGAH